MSITASLAVLVASPNASIRATVSSMLAEVPTNACLVTGAQTLEEAKRAVGARAHDVCLMDAALAMPPANLLGEAVASGRPVIVLLAADDVALEERALAGGAWGTLVASQLTPAILRAFVGRAAAHSRAARRAASEAHARKMQAVSRLAGGVAHDFNNLLTAIIGYAEMLREEFPASDPRSADVGEIQAAAERATGLTRQLLTFGRRQVARLQPVDVNGAVTSFVRGAGRVLGDRVTVDCKLAPEPMTARADSAHLEQALMHLATNARDAMPRGGTLRVVTSATRLDDAYAAEHVGVVAGRYVKIEVADEGEGMSAEVLSHAFEPWFTTKEKGKGTGLGLATVYGVVHQAGGHVTIASEQGRGTTVAIYLPAMPAGA